MKKVKVLKIYSESPGGFYSHIRNYETKESTGWIEVSDEEFKTITNPKFLKTNKNKENYIVVEYVEKEEVLLDVRKVMKQFQMEEAALKAKEEERRIKAEDAARKAKIAAEKKKKEQEAKKIERARKILEKAGEL
jgi:hypothetical protein